LSKITDVALIELLSRATGGPWAVGSNDRFEFHIYKKDSDPIRYVLPEVPENVTNYDLRLMALARELAEEVIELRRKQMSLPKTY
jgi:hypothetical protein